jgi:hypothetical protein
MRGGTDNHARLVYDILLSNASLCDGSAPVVHSTGRRDSMPARTLPPS